MNELSFDIKNSADFLNKLLEDYRDFCKDKLSSRIALNCAMTAWHITDWTYNEFNEQLTRQFKTLGSYQQKLKDQCSSLQVMHDLANGTKHFKLTKHQPVIKGTSLHKGSFSNDFSRDFDISTLEIELKDGTKIYFEDEIENTVKFWKEYLETNFQIPIKKQ